MSNMIEHPDDNHPQRELIDGLREFADFLEEHPEHPLFCGVQFDCFLKGKEELADVARTLGHAQKGGTRDYFYLRKKFGPVAVDYNVSREQVCQRVVVGEKLIPAQPERIEEVIEWRCADAILATPEEAEGADTASPAF